MAKETTQLNILGEISNGKIHTVSGIQYIIGDEVGYGRFGVVSACRDEWGRDLVAKKINAGKSLSDSSQEMYLKEMQKLVALRHPNITYIHQAFNAENELYLIIERCDKTIQKLIDEDRINFCEVIPLLASDILSGLEYIHSQGYVHMDIHSKNVFASYRKRHGRFGSDHDLEFKIGDFGISKLQSEIGSNTMTLNQDMLPPEYLDPDQFGKLGWQVDIYQFGLLLLNLLCQKTLYYSNEEIVEGKPKQIAEQLNSPYSGPISKALAPTVSDRTQSSIGFWRDIAYAAP